MKTFIFSAIIMGLIHNVQAADENDNNVQALAESITSRLSSAAQEQINPDGPDFPDIITCADYDTPATCKAHANCKWNNVSDKCVKKPVTKAPTTVQFCKSSVCVGDNIKKCVRGRFQPVQSCGAGMYCNTHFGGGAICTCDNWPVRFHYYLFSLNLLLKNNQLTQPFFYMTLNNYYRNVIKKKFPSIYNFEITKWFFSSSVCFFKNCFVLVVLNLYLVHI
jgi:hypothetical protein